MLEGTVDDKAYYLEINPLAAFLLLKPHIFQSEIRFFEREKGFYPVLNVYQTII